MTETNDVAQLRRALQATEQALSDARGYRDRGPEPAEGCALRPPVRLVPAGGRGMKRAVLVLVAVYAALLLAALGMRWATRNAQLRALGGS